MTEFTQNPKQNVIKAHSAEEWVSIIASYYPSNPQGRFFKAARTDGTNLHKLLQVLAEEYSIIDEEFKNFMDEVDPTTTTELIYLWENALSIPDKCFDPADYNYDIVIRRKYVVAKFSRMRITTRQDFIDLADFFGVNVSIRNSGVNAVFPLVFPIYLYDSVKEPKYTVIVKFEDLPKPSNVFPCTFPITFEFGIDVLIRCLFRELMPSNIAIRWEYSDYP